jgi:DNA repair exonuclease SbcCD ATPase subunit
MDSWHRSFHSPFPDSPPQRSHQHSSFSSAFERDTDSAQSPGRSPGLDSSSGEAFRLKAELAALQLEYTRSQNELQEQKSAYSLISVHYERLLQESGDAGQREIDFTQLQSKQNKAKLALEDRLARLMPRKQFSDSQNREIEKLKSENASLQTTIHSLEADVALCQQQLLGANASEEVQLLINERDELKNQVKELSLKLYQTATDNPKIRAGLEKRKELRRRNTELHKRIEQLEAQLPKGGRPGLPNGKRPLDLFGRDDEQMFSSFAQFFGRASEGDSVD